MRGWSVRFDPVCFRDHLPSSRSAYINVWAIAELLGSGTPFGADVGAAVVIVGHHETESEQPNEGATQSSQAFLVWTHTSQAGGPDNPP
ncbi:unnamed protein product [Rhizoctonia solani]|uniref:Uncharacterized protein n=1 Tax=Rhizoctonia solani TaxID=456999 RepID=A0A8H2ZUX9_9AGAM|nr:unnamed protein product [Rhizoctonia solani]